MITPAMLLLIARLLLFLIAASLSTRRIRQELEVLLADASSSLDSAVSRARDIVGYCSRALMRKALL